MNDRNANQPLATRVTAGVVAVLFLLVTSTAFAQGTDDSVVFVCEHGSLKSLIAASLFNRAAADRGLRYRAVSRGVNPEERVPPAIAAALRQDGFDVEGFHPRGLSRDDFTGAKRVVAIGVELPAPGAESQASIESWSDIPPASVDYVAARAALQRHVDALLDDLKVKEQNPRALLPCC